MKRSLQKIAGFGVGVSLNQSWLTLRRRLMIRFFYENGRGSVCGEGYPRTFGHTVCATRRSIVNQIRLRYDDWWCFDFRGEGRPAFLREKRAMLAPRKTSPLSAVPASHERTLLGGLPSRKLRGRNDAEGKVSTRSN